MALAALATLAAAVLLLASSCDAAMYKVGGLDAWAPPPASKPDVYVQWGKSLPFKLGDSLFFLYPPSQDSAVQVTAKAFAACDVSDPVLALADGNSVFNLTAPGRAYFTSAAAGHCRKGQKLSVDVPTADGKLLPPSADDQAALKALAALPPAAAPVEALPTLSDNGDDSATGTLVAAGAGSVVAVAAAAALSLALFL
ncbi:early nodulin-like protein 8 [Lolium perenne]|uniref:early nodulin-like protein 8 n=1 Tax=Lolium perenne TaxID=4522 RepID=UPI0021E9EA27|nr:mavicyanin-like [Lolium perenne]